MRVSSTVNHRHGTNQQAGGSFWSNRELEVSPPDLRVSEAEPRPHAAAQTGPAPQLHEALRQQSGSGCSKAAADAGRGAAGWGWSTTLSAFLAFGLPFSSEGRGTLT